jgi:putative intracellular protease/amidase
MEKRVVFLAVPNFYHKWFSKLYGCIRQFASPIIASEKIGVTLMAKKAGLNIVSDTSFNDAITQIYEGLVITDAFTAEALREEGAVIKLIRKNYFDNKLIVAIGEGVSLLADAGILDGKKVASISDNTDYHLGSLGAKIDHKNLICVDGNIVTANEGADSGELCALLRAKVG